MTAYEFKWSERKKSVMPAIFARNYPKSEFNVINKETLLKAQKDPAKYRNLIVRIAGYSAYFVDLSPDLQNDLIARTEHETI